MKAWCLVMKKEINIREHSSYRLDLIDILKHHTVYMSRYKEKDGKIYYVEVDDMDAANAFKIGNYLIDGTSKSNYRIFSFSEEEKKKRKGRTVYSVEEKYEVNPKNLGRKQIRLYTSNSDKYFKTAVLRYYEITYIVNTLRNHNEDDEMFKRWIKCDDRNLQINHITGEYTCSGNAGLLEICTFRENLLHGQILRYFRKVTHDLDAIFLATAEDCCLAKKTLQIEKGVEKIETYEMYGYLLSQNKIVCGEI